MIGFLFHHVWWVLAAVAVIAAIAYAPALAWKFRWQIALLLACAVAAVFWQQASSLRLTLAQRDAADAKALADAQAEARKAEQATATALAARDTAYQKGQDDAKADFDALRAGLGAGTVVVRDRFKCPSPNHVPGPATAAGSSDGQAPTGFTDQDALAALAIAADGDAIARQLSLAQDTIIEYQRLCGVAP